MKSLQKAINLLNSAENKDREVSFWIHCTRCNEVHLFNKYTDPKCLAQKAKELKLQ